MENRIVAGIVATAIAIIVLAGVLMPALSNATDTHDTFTNTGLYYMESPISDDITYVFTSDGTTGTWTINGKAFAVTYTNLVVTDTFVMRAAGTTGQFRGAVDDTFKAATITVSSDGIDYNYTRANDTVSTGTWTYDYVYCAVSGEADYIMTNPSATVNYMTEDSLIYGFGVTKVGAGPWATFRIYGDTESVTVESLTANITITNVQINKTPIDGYIGLYDFDSVTFTATDSSSNTVDATYNAVIIPAEVTAEKAQHLDPAMNTILSVIPIIIIVAVLLGVVAIFMIRRE